MINVKDINLFKLDQVKYKNILSIEDFAIKEVKMTRIVGSSGSEKSTLGSHLIK